MSEIVPEGFVPAYPWEYQRLDDHDLVEVFRRTAECAEENGAEGEDVITSGLLAVLKVLAWELDDLPMPTEPNDQRTLLIQHVLHRVGDQGNGNRN